ncbi:hypothetical protein [Ktedonospora formicarum]|uniref:Uncharacterized protein n=1 Tax=Ktedonospora formicarum TaxID=2778364 RepID=A0A8J3I0G1_9CHLR|nr:hypothetical protein [Ktedonospora formicarum]GHO44535.1 hypothetical protein KSX_26980 [Ktedonospora formicarum]
MAMTKKQLAEESKRYAHEKLMEYCKVGTTVYSMLNYSNGYGTRTYSFYVIVRGELYRIDWAIAALLGYKIKETKHTAAGIATTSDHYMVVSDISRYLFGVDNWLNHRHM